MIGNHDKKWMKNIELDKYFQSVSLLTERRTHEHWLVMSHYPLLEWNGFYRDSYMIHGHTHNRLPAQLPTYIDMPRLLNAGVDINQYMPVTFRELLVNNRIYKDSMKGATDEEKNVK